jgi:hypothetical protein
MALPKWTDRLSPDTRSKGVDLSSIGTIEIVWPIECYAEVVARVREAGLAVLGGDLLREERQELRHTDDNWSCDIGQGEPWLDYVNRSCANAVHYLENMQQSGLRFTLVTSNKPDAAQLSTSYDR